MRTIQMTLDDDLVDAVDKVVKKLKTTRSAFTRQALRNAITKANIKQMEGKHREGYKKKPVSKSEFSIWESEQEWLD
jgi:metal-responsive CopG/Arc/MetJ family transcriptional regulator